MTRGVWKGPFVHPSLLKKVDKLKNQTGRKPIKTWSRNSTVIPEFVGHSFLIHNGKTFIPITISEEMVGHKLGEFSPTRKFSGHTPADKKAEQENLLRILLLTKKPHKLHNHQQKHHQGLQLQQLVQEPLQQYQNHLVQQKRITNDRKR